MEKFRKQLKIVSSRKFAKSNDLPIFVQLMIQKDRAILRDKKMLEAKQLIADGTMGDGKVYVTELPNKVGFKILHPYEDSNPPKLRNFEIVSKNVPQEQKIRSSKGFKQLQELLA